MEVQRPIFEALEGRILLISLKDILENIALNKIVFKGYKSEKILIPIGIL